MKKIFLLLSLALILASCEEFEDSIKANEKVALEKITIENGRISFPNKITFKEYYNKIKDKDESDISEELNRKFYSKNFYSLVPIITKETEFQGERHFKKYKEKFRLKNGSENLKEEDVFEHFDDLEEIMGEEVFESFLNENAEIEVNDTIYKYTDKGLLMAPKNFIQEVYSFMESQNVKSLGDINEIDTSGEYPTFNPDGGLKGVTENIYSYLAEKLPPPDWNNDPTNNEILYGSGPISTNNSGGGYTYEDISPIVNNLEVCSPSTPWLANLFGTTKVCFTHFGSNQRVKLKYYSVDFFLGFAIGIKVKHQHKGFIFWTNQDTTEMALGINSVTWYFNHNKVFNNTTYSSISKFYTPFDGRVYTSLNSYSNAVYSGQAPLPNLPFSSTVDIVIEWANDFVGTDLTESQVRNIFYTQFYNIAKNILQSQNRDMKKVGFIINQNGQSIVQYYNFEKRAHDCCKLEKVFDWGIATPPMTYNFDSGNFSFQTGFNDLHFDFKHPDITHLNIYGLAKRNGNWYGMRMRF